VGAKPHPETTLMAASSLEIEVGPQGMEWTVFWAVSVTWRTIGVGHHIELLECPAAGSTFPSLHLHAPSSRLPLVLYVVAYFFAGPAKLYLSYMSKPQGRVSPPCPPHGMWIAAPVAFSTCKYPLTPCGAFLDINHASSSPSSSIPKCF
jgi:hypothetical protein